MTMQITVESTTKESKQARGQTYWGIKFKGEWFNLFVNDKPKQGDKFEVDVKTSEWNGRTFRWATPVKGKEAPQQKEANGSWEHYAEMARAAHRLAKELEPDSSRWPQLLQEGGSEDPAEIITCDRSRARAAILNTCLIAYSEGRVALPAEPEPPEFGPGEDDGSIPF